MSITGFTVDSSTKVATGTHDGVAFTLPPRIENRQPVAWTEEDADIHLTRKAAKTQTGIDARSLRRVRDKLLAESDWTRMDDNGLSDSVKASWATYRQELRDITDTYSDLDSVVWPTKPE